MIGLQNNYLVTTSVKSSEQLIARALEIAQQLNIPYTPRKRCPLPELETKYNSNGILVVSKDRLSIYVNGQEFFFHPGMAKLRIKALKNGHTDQMIDAMGLGSMDCVLDCTLGLASDAIVANYITGAKGLVTGLEVNPLMAYVVADGIAHYNNNSPTLVKAVRGIKVINANHQRYLCALPDKSIDVIYFDPMFRNPLHKSTSMTPLRQLANHAPLNLKTIKEACRVAKKRVVMKEANGSNEFYRLGFKQVVGGKNSPVAYGVIIIGGDDE
ncbi:class I SAM-dependent methyltransferase [Peptococcaceae bacterium 1198_IL3148]